MTPRTRIVETGPGWSLLFSGKSAVPSDDPSRSFGSWSDFSPARLGYRVGQRSTSAPAMYGPTPADVTWPIEPDPDVAPYEPPGLLDKIDWPNLVAGAVATIVVVLALRRFS